MNEKLTAPGSKKCPKCGADITDDAAQGLCPACLMAAAAWQTDAGTQPVEHVSLPKLEEVATAFPDLEIVEVIGQGGMGVVYKARQPRLDRFVALKILQPAHGSDPRFAERFEREAQALARLSHPNIVTIHDFGQAGGYYFLLMEFVDGVNLRQAMRAGRFTPEQALAIVPPVCEALQFAHEHGIVHRDIKPENLLLDKDGRVKIADFGIAKMYIAKMYSSHLAPRDELCAAAEKKGDRTSEAALRGESTEHLSGTERATVLGTPRYMAPEQQSDPLRVDHRADIYSLGVVLYELLTGEAPGSNLMPPSQRVQIDVRLDEIVLRALNVKPEMRWQTASEMKTQVQSLAQKPPVPDDPQQRLYHAMGYHTVWGQRLLKLSFIGFLSFLGFLPGLEALRILMVFFTFMGVAAVIEWRHRIREGESPKSARSRWHKALMTVAMAILIVIPLRAWVIEAFVIPVNSMAPEMPAGSRVLVWKLTSSYAPGDIVAHRHGPQVWVSRVVRVADDHLVTQRNQWPEENLPRVDVIGKVVSVYWRAPAQQGTATERLKESVEEKRRAAMANTPPVAGSLREQLQAQLTERSAKLGPAHPDVILLRQTLADMARREDDAPAVSDAENTSERLLGAVVKPIEFAVGEQRFAPGDSITIESVEATSPALGRGDIVVVKGRFVLQSANEAMLALYLGHKANGGRSKTLPEQTRMIAKGSDVFELRCAINYEGRLHVRFYPKNRSGAFGEIWVGPAAQTGAAKPKSVSSSPVAIPRPAITQSVGDKAGVVAQIQTAFDAVAKLKNMEQGQRYEVPVGGVPELSPGDDFLRRRTGREVFDSGLSCGCGDHALAFMHLMEPSGLELLMVDGAQISFRALETHWSGHVVVAVKVPKDGPWILADPTQRKIIDENWQRDAKSFYDGRYWIGYAGPISGYPAHTPDELRQFLGKTLATVPPEVFARQMMKFRFKLDASLFDADGKCVNAYAEKMNEQQDSLLKKYKITPAREIDVLLVKGGDDASGTITLTEDRGWVATVGLRSGCSSGYIDYMNQQVARKVNVL